MRSFSAASFDATMSPLTEYRPVTDDFSFYRPKGALRWILAHAVYKNNKWFMISWFIFTVFSAMSVSLMFVSMGRAIDEFIVADRFIITSSFITVIITGFISPFADLGGYFSREYLAQHMERDVREEFYLTLLGKSQSFHDNQRIGNLMALATNDTRQLNFFISPGISIFFEATLNLFIPIVYIIWYYPTILLITPGLFIISFAFALWRYVKKLGPIAEESQTQFGVLNAVTDEHLLGIEVVKGMAQENQAIYRFNQEAQKNANLGIQWGEIEARYIPFLLVAVCITVGLGHGIYLYQQDLMKIGDIIGYVGLLLNFRFVTGVSLWAFALVRSAVAATHRILSTLNQSSEIGDPNQPLVQNITGHIVFDHVWFKYPGMTNWILKDVSFEILPGQTVAIVGMTGAGKTTLTKLISRLYDIQQGRILIDGEDIRHYSLQSLRGQVSYIEQDIFLFSKSVRENITFSKTASEEEIITVAKDAQAHDFIMKLPQQYDTTVGERGVQLSGGERQRIAIARAFLKNPHILILDDSTSSIDSETEEKIQIAMSRIVRQRTTILITHRLSQIRWADQIIVMHQGQIPAQGTHKDLLACSPEYQKIFITRFDKTLAELLQEEQAECHT